MAETITDLTGYTWTPNDTIDKDKLEIILKIGD